PRHEPRGAARPRAPGAPELSLRPPRRPGLLACGVGHVAGYAAPTPRGLARRARALRAPRAPAPSLSPRRQAQDEQLSAESSPSPEVPCKVTGIGPNHLVCAAGLSGAGPADPEAPHLGGRAHGGDSIAALDARILRQVAPHACCTCVPPPQGGQ